MADIKIDPSTTVLMVQKLQKDWLKLKQDTVVKLMDKYDTLAKTKKLVAAAREVGMPIVWVRHLKRPDGADQFNYLADVADHVKFLEEGTPGAEFIEGLEPLPGEHVITARRYSSFYGTDLEVRLRRLRTKTLMFTGLLTNVSIVFTVGDAFSRDFESIVVSDCCVCGSEEINDYYMKEHFTLMSKVRTAEEILAALKQ